ncbi:lipopolysaccharide assembly protein LapB [Daejeonella sp.]|uniref:tetratricopeptide repeat protein n=1 Tax=Daejeonella sp. TaxID=2805397 RepID=UPI0027232AC1|nr:tetratricopeptide repeat protein [Daejeonella sp.]MDO8991740.1 tetratricopeptide repeat protein [Daejeonella sp.]MDP2413645.1 tetratricopeptide repeat protein [Daejeonella sp.]
MKIKSFILAAVFSASTLMVFAQKGEVASARTSYEKFLGLKDANSMLLALPNLKTAKASIDKAVVHAKTLEDPAAWTYKALIYGEMALLDSVPATSKPLIDEAKAAHKKATELDKAGENKANLENANGTIFSQYELNQGVKAYQTSNFADAYTAFNNALNYRPGDTTITYYAGLSAINSKNYKAGIQSYEALIKTNFSANNQIYLDLSRLYTMEGDTTRAIAVASEGATKFNDTQLATQEIELSLMSGKQKEVITKISDQAQKNPENKLYPYYLGIAYSTIGESAKAEEAYLNALKIDPNFADASTNIGGIILNKGINLFNQANQLPQNQQKEYEATIKLGEAELEKAYPFLIKSSELDPKSRIALENLKTYYIIKKNQEKVTEISAKLENL